MAIVQTVLGPVSPSHLGRTLTHEHLSVVYDTFFTPPPPEYREFLEEKVSFQNSGYVRLHPLSSRDNMQFSDNEGRAAVRKDIELYKKLGGGSIVDNTSHGLERDLQFLVDIQKSTGVNIIAGTGHYTHTFQDKADANMSVEQMSKLYTDELLVGVDVPNIGRVKCGVIGEVGSAYPIHDFEKRSILATAATQEAIGCPVTFHPGSDSKAPFEIVRLYLEAGGKADKCVMSHLDRLYFDFDDLMEFAKLGTYIQYDLFGVETSFHPLNPDIIMFSDGQRVEMFMKLIKEGLADRLLMSHDMHAKTQLTSFGGYGYHHAHVNVLPRLLERGATVQQTEQIAVANPANWLQFEV